MDADWKNVPDHILDSVLDKFEYLTDCLSLGLVCSSWQSVVSDHRKKLIGSSSDHGEVPMLLVPNIETEQNDNEWDIYSVFADKFVKSKLSLPSYDRPFGGSSHGWLATLGEDLSVTFYKPFAESIEGSTVRLPPLFPDPDPEAVEWTAQYREFYLFKFTVQPIENDPNDLLFVVIYGEFCKLAYIRPAKDSTWTRVLGPHFTAYSDVIYYKDRFYALTHRGKLLNFEVKDDTQATVNSDMDDLPCHSRRGDFCYNRYLVESCRGELLQVLRYTGFSESEQRVTAKFRVFKLNPDGPRWDETKSLDDSVVFVGDNTSVCRLASELIGCHRNCIYFTHDKDTTMLGKDGPWDLGFYNMDTGRAERGFTIDAKTIAKMVTGRSPIWVFPTFNTSS